MVVATVESVVVRPGRNTRDIRDGRGYVSVLVLLSLWLGSPIPPPENESRYDPITMTLRTE